jgi:hypothetical protein
MTTFTTEDRENFERELNKRKEDTLQNFKFTMELKDYNPDGSGNFNIDMSEEVATMLIERGVIAILKDYIEGKGYVIEEPPKEI